ncbi:MAG: response regulator [Lachnospiraceae bacterium]|nr:response regulator [Lachnospiraceae bacterium]
MKSIQTKISIAITVMMVLATGTLMITAMLRNRTLLDSYSDRVILSTTEYYSEILNDIIAENEGDTEAMYAALREKAAEFTVYGSGTAGILNRDGDVIYHYRHTGGIGFADMAEKVKKHFSFILGLPKDEPGWHWGYDGRRSKIVTEELSNGLIFYMSIPRNEIGIPQARLVFQLFITSVIIVAIALIIGIFWVKSIIKPLTKMTEVAFRYANGDYSQMMEVDSTDEVGRLSKSLQTMSNALTDQIRIADEANKAKSNFLSNMSHEIRTPITAVLGFNEMILRESDDREILLYAENIKTAGNTLLSLINDILDFSKIEAGKVEIIPVDYDMSSVLNNLVTMARVRAEGKNLDLKFDFDKNLPRILNGDEVRIKQIITNILTNAVKYTERGSVTFTMGFEKDPEDENSVFLKVSVKDTGIGIKQEDMEKLFSKFERIEEKRNRNIEGTGLGMNITRSLLDMMDSELKVESVYGEGSTFSFKLRQKVIKWEPLGNYKDTYNANIGTRDRYRCTFSARNAHILMVDDNTTNLMVFKNLLKQTKVRIDTAISGDECINMCCETKYDIIFLDHMMPGKDGIETLHDLQNMKNSLNHDTPFICLTANAISGAREEYIREGFNDYMTKPIDPIKLEEKMTEYLPKDKIDRPEMSSDTSEPMVMEFSGKYADDLPDFKAPGNLELLEGQTLIDVSVGIKHCGYDDLYLDVLGSYFESIRESKKKLADFLEREDLKNYMIRIHSVKSSSKTIGALALGDKAARLEQAAREDDIDFIRAKHGEFIADYEEIGKLLRKVLNG